MDIADLEFFSLKFLPHIVFTKSSGYQFSVYKFSLKAVSSRVTVLGACWENIGPRFFFCTDLAALG